MENVYTVQQALEEFYVKNNFGENGGEKEKFAFIKFGFFSIPIPNFSQRSENIYMHDVHHLLTNNDTTWKGESSVSAWEIASGAWKTLYIPWMLTLWAMGLGVCFYPKSVFRSFVGGLHMRNILWSGLSKNEVLNYELSDLREFLSNWPSTCKNPYLWMLLSLVFFLSPFIIGIFGIWILALRF
jgi:hypothetical protein